VRAEFGAAGPAVGLDCAALAAARKAALLLSIAGAAKLTVVVEPDGPLANY
jgi:hypothetical protein